MDDYDVDINWDDDDIWGGDMDFNDDFDMDPYKNKSFLSAAAEGFLGSVVNGTAGSSDAMIDTARTYLPSSFSTGLDRLRFLKNKGSDLIREFQEGNYETVKSLQSIAKNIAGRIKTEDSYLKGKLENFSTKDFSSWEKVSGNGEDSIGTVGEVTEDELNSQLSSVMERQTGMLASLGVGINEMAANVGGGTIAAVMAGNRELVGIQSGLRDLLDYQRRVQAKMDATKIELLARTYMLNAKFYKFMEKGMHAEIRELKKVVANSAMSDYQKTTHWQATKGKVRDAVLQRTGGLLGMARENLGKDGRQEKYNVFESALSQIAGMLEMGEGVTPSWGMAGNMAGAMAGQWAMSELPRFFNQGPFQKFKANLFKNNPEYEEKFDKMASKLNNVGNKFSYNMNAFPGLLQYYSQYWEDLDEYKYNDYEDYVEQTEAAGKKPMPKAAFSVLNGLGNQGKGFVNRMMSSITEAKGSRYALRHRDAKELTKAGVWKEINNVTLVDVIPGWLRLQYETLEKIRTGNDSFTAPTYSYNRGQFVSSQNARKVVESDVFEHSSFLSAANNANKLAAEIDKDGKLTPEERQKLTLRLVQDADKEYGFNPYYYANGIDSDDEGLNSRIAEIIRDRFGIDGEKLKEYDSADAIKKAKMAAWGFDGEAGASLNEMGSLAQSLKETVPNIQDNISASRSAGNDQILRDLGIIVNKNGREQFNMDKFWDRMMKYIINPDDIELRGDINLEGSLDAGESIGTLGSGSRRDSSNISKKSRKISNQADRMQDTAVNTTQVLNETMEKLVNQIDSYGKALTKADFNNLKIDLGEIPSDLTTIRDLIEKMQAYDSRQETLLEQIAGCVCRQAGSWNKLDDQQKSETLKAEAEGKKTIMDRLRAFSPRGMFNKGVEALINNQPLVLGGILGGLGVLAMHDPKAAMLISGGMIAAKVYSKLGEIARGREPENDEDILDEDGNVILKASKLRQGDYYDMVEKRVIKEWKEIKGAIYDVANKTYVTLATLTGKLFGADGRAIIISGLSKVRDTLVKIWNKVDIFGNFSNALTKGKEMFYQQDVYVRGDKEPRLTRAGFMNGKYYCYNTVTKEPFPVRGWNELKGPVYELGPDGTLNQIVSEADIAQGLVTSSGVAIDKMGQLAKWTGMKLLDGLGKAKDYSLEKAGLLKDKAKEVFANDYSGIEGRLDRIYMLLCKKFGIDPNEFGAVKIEDTIIPQPKSKNPIDDIVDNVDTGETPDATKTPNAARAWDTDYPEKIRLNSLEDQEIKEEKKKRDDFYDDVAGIRTRMDEEAGKGGEDGKEKKKGLLGTIAGWLVGKDSFLKKLITNPVGFVLGGLVNNIIKAPGRIMTMGSLLFKGVLGIGSPIYNILSWGFGGMMWGLRKLLFSNVETFGDWFRGRRGTRAERRGRRRANNRRFRLAGKFGKLLGAGLTAYTAYEGYKGVKGMLEVGSSARDILSQSSDEYDRFYGEPQADDDKNGSQEPGPSTEPEYQSTLGEGMSTPEVAMNLGLGGAQALGTAKMLGAGKTAAGEVGARAAGRVGEKLVGKTAAKVGAKAIPFLGQALMAMDGYDGFTNKDEIGEIFNKNVINGRERLANGVSNILDLGGAISGTMNWAADKTGFEFLRQQGGMTRAIDTALSGMTWGPLKYLTPVGWLSMWETEVSQAQNRVRLAMYGLSKGDSEFGRAIGAMEYQLNDYVKFNENTAWFDKKAPIAEIINSFTTSGDPTETIQWFNLRFKPIYLTFQSALRMVGFQSLQDFDRSKSPSVLKVIEQVRTSIISISPYPLDIVALVDKKNPIMARQASETVITDAMADLNKQYEDRGIKADGSSEVANHIKSAKEYADGVATKGNEGVLDSIRSWSAKKSEESMSRMFPEEGKVVNIDITDLHKDQDTEVDLLTLVRLAAYGNVDNNPSRVDAVLKLERYCESMASFANGQVVFSGQPNLIYNLFKNSFRCTDAWAKEWMTWFNQRFLPVFKKWFSEVYKLRRAKPEKVWKTLSASNRHAVGFALVETIVVVDKDTKPIWDISESPFMFSESGTDSSVTKPLLNNLEMKATEAKLKTPDLELEKSKVKDMGSSDGQVISKDREQAMMDRLLNKKGLGSGSMPSNYSPNVPLYTTTDGPNSYTANVDGALGRTNTAPGSAELSQLERTAGDYSGSGGDFKPESLQTEKGFEISEREAIKTILNEFVKAGIKDNRVLAFALANAKAETGFQGRAESLNYTPESILKTWPTRFTPQQAQEYGRVESGPNKHPANQKMIAKIAYGSRYGNQSGEDGWQYRGRGFTQLTFKNNYKRVGQLIGERIDEDPEKVTKDPVTAAKTAAGFFKMNPAIVQNLMVGNVRGAARVVGTEDRGINRKIAAYPEFLKRLTQGDLKGILNASEEGAKDSTQEETDQNDPNLPADAPQVDQKPVGGLPTDPSSQAANTPTQQAADKVNAPPQSDDGSADMSKVAPVTPPVEQAPAEATPPPVEAAPASAPTPPVSSEPAAPVEKPKPAKKEEPAKPVPMAMPDGVMQVSDAGVVQAIASLADVITRSMSGQTSLGGRSRVKTD